MHSQADPQPGAWRLSRNSVWNVPDQGSRIDFEHVGRIKVKALVVDSLGRVFGPRTLQTPNPAEGYALFGRVSVGGRSVHAFTSSQMFMREDGSLIDVAVLRISPLPPFKNPLHLLKACVE